MKSANERYKKYAKTEKGKATIYRSHREWRLKNLAKRAAYMRDWQQCQERERKMNRRKFLTALGAATALPSVAVTAYVAPEVELPEAAQSEVRAGWDRSFVMFNGGIYELTSNGDVTYLGPSYC